MVEIKKCYHMAFLKDHSEIQIRSNGEEGPMKWRWISQSLMNPESVRFHKETTPNDITTYGVAGDDKVTGAVEKFEFLHRILPAPIESLTVDTDVFLSEQETGRIAHVLIKLKEVDTLRISGSDKFPSALAMFVNGINIRKSLYIANYKGTGDLQYEKLAAIPYKNIRLPMTTTVDDIMTAAHGHARFEFKKLRIELCRSVIYEWLSRRDRSLDRLSLYGNVNETSRVEDQIKELFQGLKLVKGSRDISYIFQDIKCPEETYSLFYPVHYMQKIGVMLHREDGAKLCVYYRQNLVFKHFSMRGYYSRRSGPRQPKEVPDVRVFPSESCGMTVQNNKELSATQLATRSRDEAQKMFEQNWFIIQSADFFSKCEEQEIDGNEFNNKYERFRGGYLRLQEWSNQNQFRLSLLNPLQSLRRSRSSDPPRRVIVEEEGLEPSFCSLSISNSDSVHLLPK